LILPTLTLPHTPDRMLQVGNMLKPEFGANMGLAAGYGIHQSSNDSSNHVPNNEPFCGPAFGCDAQHLASCPRRPSAWYPSNSAQTERRLQCARGRSSLDESPGRPQSFQLSRPAESLPLITDLNPYDAFEQAQTTAMKSSQSPSSTRSSQSVGPLGELEMFDDETPSHPTPSRPTAPRRPTQSSAPSRPGRLPHSVIERRYRDNLNRQLDTLRNRLPNFKESFACSAEIEDSGLPAKWPSKAIIIAAAIRYIEQIESERDRAKAHAKGLQDQVDGLQKLVRCDDCSIMKYLETLQASNEFTNA